MRNTRSEQGEQMRAAAVVVAAGSSSRIGGKVRKPYLKLQNRPILSWTLSSLSQLECLRQIVVVTRPEDREAAEAAAKAARLPRRLALTFADGGARRQDSVFNGLKATTACEVVLIHDAARPFPPMQAMEEACRQALNTGAAILAIPVKDTVKRQGAEVALGRPSPTPAPISQSRSRERLTLIEATVPRTGLWLAQTPQVFRRQLILELFERLQREAPLQEVTDDAAICELFKQPVALVTASETNLKVTRPDDLPIAEAYLKAGLVE